MRMTRRLETWVLVLAASLTAGGCGLTLSDLAPKTTVSTANGPVVPSPAGALVVFARPPGFNLGQGMLRIIDEQRHVLADLAVNEHAIISGSPGAHEFFAYEWSSGIEQPWCVGVLRATLEGGQVYAVRAAQYPSVSAHAPWSSVEDDFDCRRIELLRVPADERPGFWSWLRASSPRRALLTEGRERSVFLDAPWRSERALAAGTARAERGPGWSASWSVLAAGDGEGRVP
jgi:hypothetical protein